MKLRKISRKRTIYKDEITENLLFHSKLNMLYGCILHYGKYQLQSNIYIIQKCSKIQVF